MRRIAALGAVVILLGGCTPAGIGTSPTESATLVPTASDAPSATSTFGSSPSASETAHRSQEPTLALGPDVIAEVVTSDLVMRTAPLIAPESIIYPGRLGPGDRLYLVAGPVTADGYDWYLGLPYETGVSHQDATGWVRFGWAAAADKMGESWLAPIEPECPPEATTETLHDLQPVLRLACFGDMSVSLEGDVSCPDLGPPIPTPEPEWLTWGSCHLNPSGAPPYDPFDGESARGIAIHYPPGAEREIGSLRITGHFDDARATQCQFSVPVPADDRYSQGLYHQETQLGCRGSLVVDSAAPVDD